MNSPMGKYSYSCKYPNCKNAYRVPKYGQPNRNKHFFRFPVSNKSTLCQWKEICNIEESVNANKLHLCEDHFRLQDFVNSDRKKLNKGVVPVNPCQNLVIDDHNYTRKPPNDDCFSDIESVEVKQANSEVNRYSFLLEINQEVLYNLNSSTSELQSKKLMMLNITQEVTSNLLKLKHVLQEEAYLLKELNWLYNKGKFNCIEKLLDCVSHEFIEVQLENANSSAVTKWSRKENHQALSLYNKSEKLYKYLCAYFNLPPVRFLKVTLSSFPLETGIKKNVIDQIELNVVRKYTWSRSCVLIMGEMSLTSGLSYEESQQRLYGYADQDYMGRSRRLADRALVLMARGVRKNWCQFVGYYFGSGPISGIDMCKIISDTIAQLDKLGLKVIALVCEPNNTNLNSLKLMGVTIPQSCFIRQGRRIRIIFDARHLISQTREALAKCIIVFDEEEGKTAKLEYIQSAFNLDQSKRRFKSLWKLRDHYFSVDDLSDEEKITSAVTVLSHTVAAAIENFVLCGDLPQEAMNTAEFAKLMDTLFDSLTGSQRTPVHYKKYRCALSRKSPHIPFWKSLVTQMDKWKLFDINHAHNVTGQYNLIKNWQGTMESLIYIWTHWRHDGLSDCLSLKRFSLVPLENLFSEISRYGTNGEAPTCEKFVSVLKGELIKVNEDPWPGDDFFSTALESFTKDLFSKDRSSGDINQTYFDGLDFNMINSLKFHEAVAHLSGYLLQKLDIPDCEACRSHLLADWVINNTEVTSLKAIGDESKYSLYASDCVIRIVHRILQLLYGFLKDNSEKINLEDTFKNLHKRELESFKSCSIHRTDEELIDLCIKLGIHRFIHFLNHDKVVGVI